MDIVLPETGILLEVIYGKSTDEDDLQNLVKAAEETGFKPYLLTKDDYETKTVEGTKIELIPLYVFCLCV